MSNLVAFIIKDDLNYKTMDTLSRKIIKYCLNKKFGVLFNFLGYSQELINSLNPKLYFSLSDDFIQLNSEFLTTSNIEDIDSNHGKKLFLKQFAIFDDIFAILLNDFGLKRMSLLIYVDGSADNIEGYSIININSNAVAETLYESVLAMKEDFAYDFPDIVINIDINN